MKIPHTNDLSYLPQTNDKVRDIQGLLPNWLLLSFSALWNWTNPEAACSHHEDTRAKQEWRGERGRKSDRFIFLLLFWSFYSLAAPRNRTNDVYDMTGFHFSSEARACSSNRRCLRKWRGKGAGSQLLSNTSPLLLLFPTCCALIAATNNTIKRCR